MSKAQPRHKSVSPTTATKLRKLLRVIQPEHFNMGYWFFTKEGSLRDDLDYWKKLEAATPSCKTAGCLGGWCAVVFPPTPKQERTQDVADYAQKTLGLTQEQRKVLFFVTDWPDPYADLYDRVTEACVEDPSLAGARLEITKARVEHFIRTGK